MKPKIWCVQIQGFFGYGLTVYGDSKSNVTKYLKEEFKKQTTEKWSMREAMEYWGGGIFEIKLGIRYDDCNREY